MMAFFSLENIIGWKWSMLWKLSKFSSSMYLDGDEVCLAFVGDGLGQKSLTTTRRAVEKYTWQKTTREKAQSWWDGRKFNARNAEVLFQRKKRKKGKWKFKFTRSAELFLDLDMSLFTLIQFKTIGCIEEKINTYPLTGSCRTSRICPDAPQGTVTNQTGTHILMSRSKEHEQCGLHLGGPTLWAGRFSVFFFPYAEKNATSRPRQTSVTKTHNLLMHSIRTDYGLSKETCIGVVWSTQTCMRGTHAIPIHMHNTQHTAITRSPAPAPAVLAWLPPNHQCHPRWCWVPRPPSPGAQTDCSCPWQTKRKK